VGKLLIVYLKVKTTLSQIWTILIIKLYLMYLKIKTKIGEVRTWLETQWTEIKEWVEGLWETVKTLGINLVGGFWAGLQAKWEEVKSWWKQVTGGLAGEAETELDIHSPSRKMMRIGQMAAEGLIRGFDLRAIAGRIRASLGLMTGAVGGALGGVHIDQLMMNLPGVRDGYDMGGVMGYLEGLADQVNGRSQVAGGIT
jgi:hypothetical protein